MSARKGASPLAGGAPPPPKRKSWFLPSLVAVIVAVGGVVALFVVPVSQHVASSFQIQAAAGPFHYTYHNETFPRSGTYYFAWASSTGRFVTFYIFAGSSQLYTEYASESGGQISVKSGQLYSFSIYYNLPVTVFVNGTYQWTGAAITFG